MTMILCPNDCPGRLFAKNDVLACTGCEHTEDVSNLEAYL